MELVVTTLEESLEINDSLYEKFQFTRKDGFYTSGGQILGIPVDLRVLLLLYPLYITLIPPIPRLQTGMDHVCQEL
jgi:hypothetical protein